MTPACHHVTLRPYRDDPAEWCDADAEPGSDYCTEHAHLHETDLPEWDRITARPARRAATHAQTTRLARKAAGA